MSSKYTTICISLSRNFSWNLFLFKLSSVMHYGYVLPALDSFMYLKCSAIIHELATLSELVNALGTVNPELRGS